MKALLLSKYKQLEITDLPEPWAGPGEVLVRAAGCGTCGSDVHGGDFSRGFVSHDDGRNAPAGGAGSLGIIGWR